MSEAQLAGTFTNVILQPVRKTNQEIVDDAAETDGCVECTTSHTGATLRVPYNITTLLDFAIPSNIETLLTGFGQQSDNERLDGIKKFVSLGGDVNAQNGILVLAARQMPSAFMTLLFVRGARIADSNGKLFTGNPGSVFGNMTSEACIRVVLMHLYNEENRHYYNGVYADLLNFARIDRFTTLTDLTDYEIPAVVHVITECFKVSPDETLKYVPTCVTVRAILLVDHDIEYPGDTFGAAVKSLCQQHTAIRLARLDKIDSILSSL